MKLIELIKEKLGIDAKDLEGELNLDTVKVMQSHLGKIADELSQDQELVRIKAEEVKQQAWVDSMRKARAKTTKITQARKTAKDMKGRSPGRVSHLRRTGKID